MLNKLEREIERQELKVSEELQIKLLKFREEIQKFEKKVSEIKQFIWNKARKISEKLLKILIDKYSNEYPIVRKY